MPASRVVNTSTGSVTVNELRALQAIQFLKLLAEHASRLGDEKGSIKFSLINLSGLVVSSEELATQLCLATTGRDQAWLEQLSFGEMADVLDAAIELNFNELNAKKIGQLGSRIKAIFELGTKSASASERA